MIFNYADIINEWFALLPKGYAIPPYSVTEEAILKEVLKKYNFPKTERLFKDNLFELSNKDIDDDGKLDDAGDRVRVEGVAFMNSSEEFTKFIYENYVYLGETVKNLDQLYGAIRTLPKEAYSAIVKLVGGKARRKLSYGTYMIGKYEYLLLEMIHKYVRLQNGYQTELWFAMLHDGKVKATSSNDGDGINSDIVKQNIGISLKNADAARVVNFGKLPKELALQVHTLVSIFTALMDQQVDTSRESLNDLFIRISDPSTIEDIQNLIAQSKDTKVGSISKLGQKLEKILNGAPPDQFISSFCAMIDSHIAHKLMEVDYWGSISGRKVILQPSKDIYSNIKCQDNKISDAIISFDNYHLWVDSRKLYKDEDLEKSEGDE